MVTNDLVTMKPLEYVSCRVVFTDNEDKIPTFLAHQPESQEDVGQVRTLTTVSFLCPDCNLLLTLQNLPVETFCYLKRAKNI